jgi:hypothetical protein
LFVFSFLTRFHPPSQKETLAAVFGDADPSSAGDLVTRFGNLIGGELSKRGEQGVRIVAGVDQAAKAKEAGAVPISQIQASLVSGTEEVNGDVSFATATNTAEEAEEDEDEVMEEVEVAV